MINLSGVFDPRHNNDVNQCYRVSTSASMADELKRQFREMDQKKHAGKIKKEIEVDEFEWIQVIERFRLLSTSN